MPSGGFSLRGRLMAGAAVLAVLFMLVLLSVQLASFERTLDDVIEQRLAADVSTLIGSARIVDGQLLMPDRLPDEEFNLPDAKLLGFIHDRWGRLVWQSRSAYGESVDYLPRYDGRGTEFLLARDRDGEEYFVYDVEVSLGNSDAGQFSFITMQPTSEYRSMLVGLRDQLYLWLGGGLLALLGLLWLGLTLGFRSLRRIGAELDGIERGSSERLSDRHPSELLRLTGSLNRLLDGERRQRERYRHSLGDLAHSLKTPLAVLQNLSDDLAGEGRPEAPVMRVQIERMSQQIGYHLQRASLGHSGLIRHRVALAPLLDQLCSTLAKVYHGKRVNLTLALADDLQVPMEQAALMELLGNLLENAYRLCISQVRIGARWQAGVCEIIIEDDGPGVPTEQRQRILQRGERLDGQHPGQGIGLAVVKDILESYGGELQLDESRLGGARFRVSLP